jgi:small-conductance mechanosensitive channel
LIPYSPFFALRDWVRGHAPVLLGGFGSVEYWQIAASLLVATGSILAGMLGATQLRRGSRLLGHDPAELPRSLTWAVGICVGMILASRFPGVLGMPEGVRRYSYPLLGSLTTVAAAVVAWHLLRVVGVMLQRMSDRTATATDGILFNLLLAAARLGVVVLAFLSIANFLSIPTGGIVAGLGIGGLAFAFASRETLSNVFGAGILVADRPFRRGDWIISGDIEGAIEHVGIRSTRVRTAQDSLMVVPNGKLSDSTINNLGTRRFGLIKAQLVVTAGATPDRLDEFTVAIHGRVAGDPAFVDGRVEVAVANITSSGVQIDLTAYLKDAASSEERATRHALLIDIVRLAQARGLTLGPGMKVPDPSDESVSAAQAA